MVRLAGSVHPLARPELDVGHLDPETNLSGSLLFRMSPLERAIQRDLLAAVQNPSSPHYHRWLSPEEYAAQFGAGAAETARAVAWLRSQGLSTDAPSRTGTRLPFQGPASAIERAFRTELHRYAGQDGEHFAMSSAPSVPADLAPRILGVHGLNSFRSKTPRRAEPLYALPVTEPDGGPGSFAVLAPADFAKIYDLESLYAAHVTGAGQHIAVIGRSDFNDADVASFRSTFGLPASSPVRLLVPGSGATYVRTPGDLAEADLDLEWAGAVAPDATIHFAYIGDAPNSDVFDALNYAIEEHVAPVITLSYGGACEAELTPTDAILEEEYGDMAALEGITVVAASGDTGAAACDGATTLAAERGEYLLLPGSIPSIVAVGGSQFQISADNQSLYLDSQLRALSYIPESGWNETLEDIDAGYGGLGAGGGGVSRLFSKPYWQTPLTPKDGFRDVPDVAMSASADVLPYAVSVSWTAADGDAQPPQPQALTAYGGTSVSAPAVAGILALVNQALSDANPAAQVGLGNANPVLYALAHGATANAFHDVTAGDNIVPCVAGSPDCPSSPPYQFGYAAGPGYDQVTGLGSIDAANLVAAWRSLTPTSTTLQASAGGTAEGSPLDLKATVASKGGTNAMTGSITFYFAAPSDGGIGISGTLGTVPIVPSASSGGTASLTTNAPGGLHGSGVTVSAFYGGDPNYLASWSQPSPVSGTSAFSICPTEVTIAVGESVTFTASGGSPPVQWGIERDTTCTPESQETQRLQCASIQGGIFTPGPRPGTATVVAIDAYEAYATARVTVVDAGTDGSAPPAPMDSCAMDAGGPDGMKAADGASPVDGNTDGAEAAADAGSVEAHGSASGCACAIVDDSTRDGVRRWMTAGLLLLAAVMRRLNRHPLFARRVGR
jgi:subtilase family serine protease